ncbi:MAG: polysulfide reductase NrfD [Acidobacteria bacterium]|nr:polysulfide reductase NrfD [Acidobacteriota bacterium]
MRYAFVVDNHRCIGCHACSVACKTENHVPLGVFRTWVKYVEKGRFPNTRRHFQVTRCNHCAEPPCVAICPVAAVSQRRDGIVDFNSARCIGCKACMQACPYDAIYIDPERHTAAKCNFCVHRTDLGLAPTCVAACPARAIIAGDLDDPQSEISRIIGRGQVSVRKAEQGTRPMLFYVGAEQTAIIPGASRNDRAYMWSEPNHALDGGHETRAGLPTGGRTVYDVEHERPWGWQIPTYFWTKSISAGIFAVPALACAAGLPAPAALGGLLLSGLALLFMAATLALLLGDLSRRERFLRVLRRPRWQSWVSRGAFLLVAYVCMTAAFGIAHLVHAPRLATLLLLPTAITGGLAAVYTAFLLGQCEGRDLWQAPLLPLHLIVQAAIAGTAVLAVLGVGATALPVIWWVLAAGLGLHLLMVTIELGPRHATGNSLLAARAITRGRYRRIFWGGAIVVGGVMPALLLAAGPAAVWATAASGGLALLGLLAFEWCFIMGGQIAPNS